MDLIIQSEYFWELLVAQGATRDVKSDAPDTDRAEEKVYE